MTERKPREFWIIEMFDGVAPILRYQKPLTLLPNEQLIHVREVLLDEPDYRAMCEELALILGLCVAMDDAIKKTKYEALAKWEKMK